MKKIDYAVTALKTIIEGQLSLVDMQKVAQDALEKIGAIEVVTAEKKAEEVAIYLMKTGKVFLPAEETAKVLNDAAIKTIRGGEWTKSTATAVMQDVRPLIEKKLLEQFQGIAFTPAAPVVLDGAVNDDDEVAAEPVEAVQEAPVAVAAPAAAKPVKAAPAPAPAAPVAAPVVVEGSDELDDLLADLNVA